MKTNILICVISLLLAVCSISCSNHSTERVKFTDIDKSIQDTEKNGGDCYSKTEQTVTVLMAQN